MSQVVKPQKGMAEFVLANGSMSSQQSGERETRKNLMLRATRASKETG